MLCHPFLDMNSWIFFTQVMLSIYMIPYSLYLSLAYWIYPLKDYIGDTGCYVAIYGRDIGIYISQSHSFFMAVFRYNCLFNGIFLKKINLSPNVSSCLKSGQMKVTISLSQFHISLVWCKVNLKINSVFIFIMNNIEVYDI